MGLGFITLREHGCRALLSGLRLITLYKTPYQTQSPVGVPNLKATCYAQTLCKLIRAKGVWLRVKGFRLVRVWGQEDQVSLRRG